MEIAADSPKLAANISHVSQQKQKRKKVTKTWTRPTFTPEHGVLLVLGGSFLIGAALAQQWTFETTLALICAFFALQAEHPYVVQIKLRKNLKPRYLFWCGIYASIALGLAIFLAVKTLVSKST